MPMNPSARLFHCARCHCQVIVCRHCDHGNVYCANGCAVDARTTSLRRAAKRYRSTRRGRHSNADRQRRFRARQREKVPKVGALGDASGFPSAHRPCSTAIGIEHRGKSSRIQVRSHGDSHLLPCLSLRMRFLPQAFLSTTPLKEITIDDQQGTRSEDSSLSLCRALGSAYHCRPARHSSLGRRSRAVSGGHAQGRTRTKDLDH